MYVREGERKESTANRRSPDNTSARQLIYASAGIKYDADGEHRDCNCRNVDPSASRFPVSKYRGPYVVEPAINWTSGRRCKKVGQTAQPPRGLRFA